MTYPIKTTHHENITLAIQVQQKDIPCLQLFVNAKPHSDVVCGT